VLVWFVCANENPAGVINAAAKSKTENSMLWDRTLLPSFSHIY
jgi:hypothetical protein